MVTPPPDPPALPAVEIDLEGSPLSPDQRKRVLSAGRLKLSFTFFVVLLLAGLSLVMFMGVSRIFDWLTPSTQRDLEWKTQRGALELAQTAQLGMLVKDPKTIAAACRDYLTDPDVLRILVVDPQGAPLFEHGAAPTDLPRLFRSRPGVAHHEETLFAAWAPSEIEGTDAGRVALFVSKARLEAGADLRRQMLTTAAIACFLALAFSIAYVTFYIGPILRVTAQAFQSLERTTEAALAATRMKSQFLANMSHEIRTPMNGIVGVLDLLNRTVLSSKQQRYAQTIDASARGLLTIIDDVLDFSKLEAGKLAIRAHDFELRQTVQEVVELLAPKAHGKHIELVHRVDADVPYSVIGDVDRIKQIITNLVGNAIKFTEEGHVEVRVIAEASVAGVVLRFAIKDTGPGISAEDRAKLFEMFSQVDGSLTRKHGGTGLGLAISRRLVDAMGGEIGVDSDVGKGSTFWFTVPTRQGALVPPDDGIHPRECRILIVSRDVAQRDMMCDLVARWSMSFSVADTAARASTLVMEGDPRPFEVAVVDGSFDGADEESRLLLDLCVGEGLPLLRLLSTTQKLGGTGSAGRELCLTKPVRVSELYNGLVSLLDGVPMVRGRRRAETEDTDGNVPKRERGTVLVVDDNEINRLVAVDLLTEFGYSSDVACNGVEALEKVTARPYAAILMDCQMPEMDGYEATRRIRGLPGSRASTPIIALTAHAMAGDRDRVLEAGMDDYTAKPVRARALERILDRWTTASGDQAAPSPVTESAVSHAEVDGAVQGPESEELDPTLPRAPRVVDLFLRSTPELLDAVLEAARERRAEELQKVAHKLKGSCLSLGIRGMACAAAQVEREAREGRVDVATAERLPPLFAMATELLELEKSKASGRPRSSQGARSP